jgi:hypothetical protein
MAVEKLTKDSILSKYFILYDKETNEPMLDPCFSEYLMMFVCGHEKSHFSKNYKMEDQYCESCKALRQVKAMVFKGVDPKDIDYDRSYEIKIHFKEWDCESKSGIYYLMKPRKMPNGKWIAGVDYMAAPNFGTFTDSEIEAKEEKHAEMATAKYSDWRALTVFEIPDYVLANVPEVVQSLLQYLQIGDTMAYKMKQGPQKGDGTYKWERIEALDPSKLTIPHHKTV